MKTFLLLIGGAVVSKFVKDNLPDLHYKKILQFCSKAWAVFRLVTLIALFRLGLVKLEPRAQAWLLVAVLLWTAPIWLKRFDRSLMSAKPVAT